MTSRFPRPPDSGSVHLWRGRATAAADPAELAVLATAELARFRAMVPAAGARYAGSRAAVRRILAGYLDEEPGRLVLDRKACPGCGSADHGPPILASPHSPLTFSLSRSGNDWLLAVSADRLIGVDLEGADAVDLELVSPMVMTPAELTAFRTQLDEHGRRRLFLRAWTRKEAVLKAAGIGLVAPLREIDVQPAVDRPVTVAHDSLVGAPAWVVQDVATGSADLAALAWQADLPPAEISWPGTALSATGWQQLAAGVS
ncbi:4'-phosphopantetheinyl transferase family protein [Kribbella sp. CA-293567]|uniref:4'-phosphopantetheinyl transferase family protein n=1 Tax=Kribbella sp. CA-293567 TaxID=3002436 RepID=UPI0022DDE1BD|nr:4'-phosphopantetheinyl transferase superfamily protein [Kribbella sp. CA-293567]WBQ08256.1 4'-phosphopantetheinyl transferase superfamily protein [Kribbella sp. CA-293567]